MGLIARFRSHYRPVTDQRYRGEGESREPADLDDNVEFLGGYRGGADPTSQPGDYRGIRMEYTVHSSYRLLDGIRGLSICSELSTVQIRKEISS